SVQSYPNQVRTDGAELYWRYDDTAGPYVADTSRSGNTGGVQLNSPGLGRQPGAIAGSTAMAFNGSDQKVYSDHRQSVGNAFTVETWFKTDTTRGGHLIGFAGNTAVNNGAHDRLVYLTNTGQLVFGVAGAKRQTITTGTQEKYNDNKWHHVAATQGPGGITLYVDGQNKGMLNATSNSTYSGYWNVGGGNLAGWPDRPGSDFFAGLMATSGPVPCRTLHSRRLPGGRQTSARAGT
ncbi:LamG domain-containing protein, partial [Streptomyces sp. NPDC047023]|uniref:LamG domain-containing protein n=1 Tax=Streptomyces sp. NPDC047023 TaxID=3155139 RepID=UPI0033DA5002